MEKRDDKLEKRKVLAAYLGLFLMTLIIGLSFLFVKIGLRSADSYDLLAHRFTAAFIAVVILKLFNLIKIERLSLKEWLNIFKVALFYPILCFAFQTVGLEYTTASQAGIVFALLPILTIIAASIFLKEKTTLLQKAGVALSLSGLVVIFLNNKGGGGDKNIIGVALILLSVISMVIYYMSAKKIMKKYASITLTSAMILIGFIFFNAIALIKHTVNGTIATFFNPLREIDFIFSILYLGVLSSVLTAFLSNFSLKFISTAQVSVFNNISPIVAILGGVLFLGESLTSSQIVGGTAVILGVLFVLWLKAAPNK